MSIQVLASDLVFNRHAHAQKKNSFRPKRSSSGTEGGNGGDRLALSCLSCSDPPNYTFKSMLVCINHKTA